MYLSIERRILHAGLAVAGALFVACGGEAAPAAPFKANLPGSVAGGCWNGGPYTYAVESDPTNSAACPDLSSAALPGYILGKYSFGFDPNVGEKGDGIRTAANALLIGPSEAGTYDAESCMAIVSWTNSERLNGCPATTTHTVAFDRHGGVSGSLRVLSKCEPSGTSVSCSYTTSATGSSSEG